MLKLTLKQPTGFLFALAELIGGKVDSNGRLNIPEKKGNGYIQGFMFDNSVGLMIRNYELNQDLLAKRIDPCNSSERIVVTLNNVFPKSESDGVAKIEELPSIQIGKGKLNFEMFYPSKTKYRSILLAIDSNKLRTLMGIEDESSLLNMILNGNQPLLFEEVLSPQIQKVAMEMIENEIPENLHHFYIRIKAEELLCLLFVELHKRENAPVQALNEKDALSIYRVRDKIVSNLGIPPILGELANEIGMSESKLKRLFKQIFGSSIYNYYQKFRMQEAARLLKGQQMSVSEVGYQLGFSNLSHFTKVFEEHIGMKPKKYSVQSHK
ncbi:AraC family transcriptional regulator [Limibacter armeniacum]|uniref:helix-turn-helix transcriptional regulator n=1 Tax=Limibacter armeniacum TaxID=466084 RepID=UPI002FE5AE4A